MPAWISLSWARLPQLLLESAALFLIATFVFDVIHYTLHQCLKSRRRWLRVLGSPHLAHHVFCDRKRLHRLVASIKGRCPQPAWKRIELRVVDPHGLNVIAASNRNAILGVL